MTNAKFTPGPWWPIFTGDLRRAVRSESGFIATLPKPNHYTGQDERYELELVELKANADLIAAVPELYEALRKIVNAPSASDIFFLIPAAKAALAKALGEKQTEP